MWSAIAWPATRPRPVTREKAPAGYPTCCMSFVRRIAERGVFSAVLKTMEQPLMRVSVPVSRHSPRQGLLLDSRSKSRPNLPRHHHDREVPWHDLPDNPCDSDGERTDSEREGDEQTYQWAPFGRSPAWCCRRPLWRIRRPARVEEGNELPPLESQTAKRLALSAAPAKYLKAASEFMTSPLAHL